MTFYEVLLDEQHSCCNVAETEIWEYAKNPMRCYRRIEQTSIDRAYVLGEIIDNLPVELAEREV